MKKQLFLFIISFIVLGLYSQVSADDSVYQSALINFDNLKSFTFSGSESGKITPNVIPSKFSGSFSNEPDNKCLISKTIVSESNKLFRSGVFSVEDRSINGNVYEFVKGISNPKINDKWVQMQKGGGDFSLVHFPYPMNGLGMICGGKLSSLTKFTESKLLRKNDTEAVYLISLNKSTEEIYASLKKLNSIPSDKVFTGEMTIDIKTMLPKKIILSSNLDSSPLFTLVINSVNIPVDIQIPANFKSLQEAAKEDDQNEKISQLKRIMTFSSLSRNPTSIFKLQKTFGTPNTNGSCSNPVAGSLFSVPPVFGIDDEPSPNELEIARDQEFFFGYVVSPIIKMDGIESHCYSSKKAYAVEIKIPGDKAYSCVDSTGFSKKTSKKITGPKCK